MSSTCFTGGLKKKENSYMFVYANTTRISCVCVCVYLLCNDLSTQNTWGQIGMWFYSMVTFRVLKIFMHKVFLQVKKRKKSNPQLEALWKVSISSS